MGKVNFKVQIQFTFNARQRMFVLTAHILPWFRAQSITQNTIICLFDTWIKMWYRDNKQRFELPPQEQKKKKF